ncbi:ribosome maturation factor RimM [Balneolales bacterium ANBcel1]|nr:ribosome maturation factor RimM [Balneolales bacterium ANBcel1]
MSAKSSPGLNELGVIVKAHGTRGGFLLDVGDREFPLEVNDLVFIRYPESQWVPYRIEEVRAQNDRNRNLFFVQLEGIQTRTEASSLRGFHVMTEHSTESVQQQQNIIGYRVFRDDETVMGTVSDVIETPAYPVMAVRTEEKTILIPRLEVFVVEVDDAAMRIITRNTAELEDLD